MKRKLLYSVNYMKILTGSGTSRDGREKRIEEEDRRLEVDRETADSHGRILLVGYNVRGIAGMGSKAGKALDHQAWNRTREPPTPYLCIWFPEFFTSNVLVRTLFFLYSPCWSLYQVA